MVKLAYGTTGIRLDAPDMHVLTSRLGEYKRTGTPEELVERALAAPLGSSTLQELAAKVPDAVIVLSDHTRPVPSKQILPPMLKALREGNPAIDITLLVATGCHRATTREELLRKLGEDILDHEKITIHDARDESMLVDLGMLPSGNPLCVNRIAADASLLLAEGFIEPHFFAGFSGGGKSILPGISAGRSVRANHCGQFIAHEKARAGILEGNPIHEDIAAAAELIGLQFIVNVVLDEKKQIAGAFAGHPAAAHPAGCEFLAQFCRVEAVPGDIVVTNNSGAPLDQNLYQCVKGLSTAEATARPGAVLILCGQCADGIGGEGFYRALAACESPAALFEQACNTPACDTVFDQWQYQILARILMKHTVILVTRPELEQTVTEMKMRYAPDVEEALKQAYALKGEDAVLTVIPDGLGVVIQAD